MHEGNLEQKIGGGYVTDEGKEIPEHDLFRAYCACGWRGQAFYMDEKRAMNHWWNHVEREQTREEMRQQ